MTTNAHPDELLAFYANDSLVGEERESVARHVADCERCRVELTFLREVTSRIKERGSGAASPGEFGLARLRRQIAEDRRTQRAAAPWWKLTAVAALIVVVVQAAALVRLSTGGRAEAPLASLTTLTVGSERFMRDVSGQETAPAVMEIPAPADGGSLMLELETDIDVSYFGDPKASFVVELLREDQTVWSDSGPGDRFAPRNGRGVVPLVLLPARLDPGSVHVLRIRVHKPGDPLHEQVVFVRHFRISQHDD